jgi:hypothetical protein
MKKVERSPARVALAESIDELRALEAQIATAESARRVTWAAITRAEEALEEFRRDKPFLESTGARLVEALAGGDEFSVAEIVRTDDREARERELQKDINTWIAARDEIRQQIGELDRKREWAESKIKDRAKAVVCEAGVIAALRDGLDELQAEVARRRRALRFASECFPPGDHGNIPTYLATTGEALTKYRGSAEWDSAFRALCENPDATLPV